jgi:hypothetical protein
MTWRQMLPFWYCRLARITPPICTGDRVDKKLEAGSPTKVDLELIPSQVALALGGVAVALVVANILLMVAKFGFGHGHFYGLASLFHLDRESNIPTLFSSCLLLLNAALLGLFAYLERLSGASYRPWVLLALIFCFLSVDETARIHERLGVPVGVALDTSGIFSFAWTIPYGILTALLAAIYLPIIWPLERRLRYLLLLSGGLYVGGAVGFEMIGSALWDSFQSYETVWYAISVTCEESLEMAGLILFMYTLMMLIQNKHKNVSLFISPKC